VAGLERGLLTCGGLVVFVLGVEVCPGLRQQLQNFQLQTHKYKTNSSQRRSLRVPSRRRRATAASRPCPGRPSSRCAPTGTRPRSSTRWRRRCATENKKDISLYLLLTKTFQRKRCLHPSAQQFISTCVILAPTNSGIITPIQ
jgi:hypothetical protein